MSIAMTNVTSSQIFAMGHDPATSIMRVQFKNGNIYQYQNVPSGVFDQIMKAESVGKAFNRIIKASPTAYPFEQE